MVVVPLEGLFIPSSLGSGVVELGLTRVVELWLRYAAEPRLWPELIEPCTMHPRECPHSYVFISPSRVLSPVPLHSHVDLPSSSFPRKPRVHARYASGSDGRDRLESWSVLVR